MEKVGIILAIVAIAVSAGSIAYAMSAISTIQDLEKLQNEQANEIRALRMEVDKTPDLDKFQNLYDDSKDELDKMNNLMDSNVELIRMDVEASNNSLELEKKLLALSSDFDDYVETYYQQYNDLNERLTQANIDENWSSYDRLLEEITELENKYNDRYVRYNKDVEELNKSHLSGFENYVESLDDIADDMERMMRN